MTANEAGLEVFIDDTTVDRRSRTYYEVYVEMHSAQIQPGDRVSHCKWKRTKVCQRFSEGRASFSVIETKGTETYKQQHKAAAEKQRLINSVGSRLQAVTDFKCYFLH